MKYLLALFILSVMGCATQPDRGEIDQLLDNWHKDAAEGNLESYFSIMHSGSRFLGTDKTEDWGKEEFYTFCKPYFEDGQGWDFKPLDRDVYFSPDGKTAWFDETLDTWMGPCRGSGIFLKSGSRWQMMQYNLTMLVDNDLIDSYLELLNPAVDE